LFVFCFIVLQFGASMASADNHGIVYSGVSPVTVVTDVGSDTGTISFDIDAMPVLPSNKLPVIDLHQPSLGLACVIALQGVYPSRSALTPFVGEIGYVGFNFAHRGWAYCDGQLLPISTNTALFSLLGTTFGGDGRTTFGLPDMRGRAPVHVGSGTGPGLRTWRLGEEYGRPEE